jgi:hypothetical protein
VLDFLNELYENFDALVDFYDLYKLGERWHHAVLQL